MKWEISNQTGDSDEIARVDRFHFERRENRGRPGPPLRRIEHGPAIPANTFWEQYVSSLSNSGWNDVAISHLDDVTDSIFENIDLQIDGRIRRTSVIGEVQSGKTASMIGLAAKGLDAGFRIIVVLAGHQNDLRNQTARRFNKDLLLISEKIGDEHWNDSRTPAGIFGVSEGVVYDENYRWTWLGEKRAYCLPSFCDINHHPGLSRQRMEKIKNGGFSGIFVIKKTVDAMDSFMNLVTDVLHQNAADFPIMVIDDEEDYATSPAPHRLIEKDAWRTMPKKNWNLLLGYCGLQTLPPHPTTELLENEYFNTYSIAYTATPQVPHKQPEFLPIGGRNLFHARYKKVLKSASDKDTFVEYDSNLPRYDKFAWYTGPEMFYGRYWDQRPPYNPDEEEPIYHPTPNLNNENYSDPEGVVFGLTNEQCVGNKRFECALMSYFVSGAIRFAQQDSLKGGNSEEFILSLESDSDNPWPETHSALIHCATGVDEHWEQAKEILTIFDDDSEINRGNSDHVVDKSCFLRWLKFREEELLHWYNYFHIKYGQITLDGADRPEFPDWIYVRKVLEHWSSNIKFKVLNSGPEEKIPLNFDPRSDNNGNPIRPNDVYTIIIGGAKLSRGLTIEGLSTSFFSRLAVEPNQATMMQHQRWCGYRAHYWEYVTLHIQDSIKEYMASWSESDQIDRLSTASGSMAPLRLSTINLVTGRPIRGGGKLAKPITLNYFGDFQFRHVELRAGEKNEIVMANFIERILQNTGSQLVGNHLINTNNKLDAVDVAEILDSLEYSFVGTDWKHTKDQDGKRRADVFIALSNWFKTIQGFDSIDLLKYDKNSYRSRLPFNQNPNLIAAYLRLWHILYHNGQHIVNNLQERNLIQLVGNLEQISEPPQFNLVFQGGTEISDESMHPIFRDKRLTELIPKPIRKAGFRNFKHVVNQMRTGNRDDLPGGNRYVDLHLGDREHPRWVDGRFMGYRYTRQNIDSGVLIGQAFDISHLYREQNGDKPPIDIEDINHVPVSFMIDIPEGGPSFIIT